MSDSIRLSGTTVDAPDALALARFYTEATGARVLAAGATRFDHQPNADPCIVYADPAGHPFCLSTWDGDRARQGHD